MIVTSGFVSITSLHYRTGRASADSPCTWHRSYWIAGRSALAAEGLLLSRPTSDVSCAMQEIAFREDRRGLAANLPGTVRVVLLTRARKTPSKLLASLTAPGVPFGEARVPDAFGVRFALV